MINPNKSIKTFIALTLFCLCARAQQVTAPTFWPALGTYISSCVVQMACSTSGATIRYTTDGTTPTTTHGTLFPFSANWSVTPFPTLTITSTTTLKMIAYKAGMTSSPVASGIYTISGGSATTTLVTSGTIQFFDGMNGDRQHQAGDAFDKNMTSFIAADTHSCIIGRAGANTIPTAVRILPPVSGFSYLDKSITLIGRTSGGQWEIIDTLGPLPSAIRWTPLWKEFPVSSTKKYYDIALKIQGNLTIKNQITEIEFYGVATIADTLPKISSRPMMTDGSPEPGKLVKQVASEYSATGVYHALYLPTNWVAGKLYPVIVEYAPNQWDPTNLSGVVEDCRLGYNYSGGRDYIWVIMPYVNTAKTAYEPWWWGDEVATANYLTTNLKRICLLYGGDPNAVFITGLSRGSIACSYIGNRDDSLSDIWVGYIMNSVLDGPAFTDIGDSIRLARVKGRPVFTCWGSTEGGTYSSDSISMLYMKSLGFPVTDKVMFGWGHCYEWAEQQMDPTIKDLKSWMTTTLSTKPGMHSVRGRVVDAHGQGVARVKVQCGFWHWTYTDSSGNYEVPSLVSGTRSLSASKTGYSFSPVQQNTTIINGDVTVADIQASTTSIKKPNIEINSQKKELNSLYRADGKMVKSKQVSESFAQNKNIGLANGVYVVKSERHELMVLEKMIVGK